MRRGKKGLTLSQVPLDSLRPRTDMPRTTRTKKRGAKVGYDETVGSADRGREFEVALRDYWLNYRKQPTRPKMFQLVNQSIPDQSFSQDVTDHADDVRAYRNFLIHDIEDAPAVGMAAFTPQQVKRHLSAYLARLAAAWR